MSSLSPITLELLLGAYSQGMFPMAQDRHGPVQWYKANPRAVLPLDQFKVPRTLRQRVKRGDYEIRFNTAFEQVIRSCGEETDDRPVTWINDQIIQAFVAAHKVGIGHSVEAWTIPGKAEAAADSEPKLVGGLYGMALGGAFFGESMFSRATDASKVCLFHLVERLRRQRFVLLDVQMNSPHMAQFGTIDIPREEYERQLAKAIKLDVKW